MDKLNLAPNQKAVTIHKLSDSDGIFCRVSKTAQQNAIVRMNGKRASGFVLWSILAGNKDGFVLKLSHTWFRTNYGITKSAYTQGLAILRESGFLVDVGRHFYDFHEYPQQHRAGDEGEFSRLSKGRETDNQKSEYQTFKRSQSEQEYTPTYTPTYTPSDTTEHGVSNNRRSFDTARQDESYLTTLINKANGLGFIYDGNGEGGEQAFFSMLVNEGYDGTQIIDAVLRTVNHRADSHTGYILSVLRNAFI